MAIEDSREQQQPEGGATNTTLALVSGDPWNGIPAFACVDLNELWAAAIPPLDESDDGITPPGGSSPPRSLQRRETTEEAVGDMEEGREVVFAPPPAARTQPDSPPPPLPTPPTADRPSMSQRAMQYLKYFYSGALLLFCIVVVAAAIFRRQTTATGDKNVHPVIAFMVFWCLILWLALMEGGLNCMVGLKPIPNQLYAHSHPKAYRCTQMAHKGDNLERFIVGRQFLDLMCVFLTNFMVSSVDGATVLGLPDVVCQVFLGGGVAVILVTIVIGQLVTQINAAHCMLDFINNYIMMISTFCALTIEGSGLLHAVYFVQIVVAKVAGQKIESQERQRTLTKRLLFWLRVVMSLAILGFALVVSIAALYNQQTTMWSNVPATASVLLLVFLIFFVGIMEGLQIALFAMIHLPEDELDKYPVARKNCQLLFRGSNLQAFLIGRQILQTLVMFMIARITTLDVSSEDQNIFGVSDGLQAFFNTGLLGAIISTILASLSWRVLASTFPIAFLSNPLSNLVIHACLFLENTGICSFAWVLAALNRKVVKYQPDEVYVGTVAERADEKDAQDLTLEDSTFTDSSHEQVC